jgi:hypothetical protein
VKKLLILLFVVPFEESAAAYEKYVDQHPEKSVKLGVEFYNEFKSTIKFI